MGAMWRRWWVRIILFSLWVLLPGSGWAGDYEDGLAAYKQGNYEGAYLHFLKAGNAGNVNAQTNIGIMFYYGKGKPQNYAESMRWFNKAAMQGNAFAMFNMGVMFYEGQGVARDLVEAYKWFFLAQERGDREAGIMARQVASEMQAAQIAKAKRQAKHWRIRVE